MYSDHFNYMLMHGTVYKKLYCSVQYVTSDAKSEGSTGCYSCWISGLHTDDCKDFITVYCLGFCLAPLVYTALAAVE